MSNQIILELKSSLHLFIQKIEELESKNEPVKCPSCYTENVFKFGYTSKAKQRYCCKNPECFIQTFSANNTEQHHL